MNPLRRARELMSPARSWLRRRAHLAKLGPQIQRLRKELLEEKQASGRRLIGIGLVEHFGDIVACEPVARFIRAQEPEAHIVWCLREPYQSLVLTSPNIDRVVPVECLTVWDGLASGGVFDRVVDLHLNLRTCPICGVPRRKTTGDTSITPDNYYQFGCLLEAFSRSAGLRPIKEGPRVYISEEIVREVNALALPENFVVIHCSSNEASRDWDSAKWPPLIREIRGLGLNVIVIGTSAPEGYPALSPIVDQRGRLGFLASAEVIRRAKLFIGVDSGPAHLANAVGTPGVVLLGSYRAFKSYMPYSGRYGDGSNAEIVRPPDGPAAILSVESVFAAVQRRLSGEVADDSVAPRLPGR